MSITSQHIRPEAGILLEQQLSPSQREAGRKVLQLLLELGAAQTTDGKAASDRRENQRPSLYTLRHNRVLLIDGGRGAGKTTLLLTILQALKDRLRVRDLAVPKLLSVDFAWTNERVLTVPVDLIDLAPLPPATNVMLHCVRRFDGVLRQLEGSGQAAPSTQLPWQAGQRTELAARREWKSLTRAITLGWDRRLVDRVERQDVESYARELEEAERQREGLGDRFSEFMDALATDYAKTMSERLPGTNNGKQLLFLLAVDDADMNPTRTLELLESVRVLQHPQIAFLLTGDSGLFEDMLRRQYRETLCGKRGRRGTDEVGHRHADRLALEVLDKLIPPGHRSELLPLSKEQRLTWEFSILGSEKQGNLKSRLDEVFIQRSGATAKVSLGSLFDATPQLREILPDRLRNLVDFVLWMESLHGHLSATQFIKLVEELWRRAVRQADLGQSDEVSKWVTQDTDGERLRITLPAEPGGYLASSYPKRSATIESSRDWQVQGTLLAVDRLAGEKEPLQSLASALRFAVSAVFLHGCGTLRSEDSNRSGYEGLLGHGVLLRPTADSELPLVFGWPLPKGLSFIEVAALSANWPPSGSNDPTAGLMDAAEMLLGRVAEYGLRLAAEVQTQVSNTMGEVHARTITVYQQVAQLAAGAVVTSARHRAFLTWARTRAGLLAAPESGLQDNHANHLLTELRAAVGDHDRWCTMRERLRKSRRDRIAFTLNENASPESAETPSVSLVTELDSHFEKHDWVVVIENGIGASLREAIKRRHPNLLLSETTTQQLDYGSAEICRALLRVVDNSIANDASSLRRGIEGFLDDEFLTLSRTDAYSVSNTRERTSEVARWIQEKWDPDLCKIIGEGTGITVRRESGVLDAFPLRLLYEGHDEFPNVAQGIRTLLLDCTRLSKSQEQHSLQSRYQFGLLFSYLSHSFYWPVPDWHLISSYQDYCSVWNKRCANMVASLKGTPATMLDIIIYYMLSVLDTSQTYLQDSTKWDSLVNGFPHKSSGPLLLGIKDLILGKYRSYGFEKAAFDKFVTNSLPIIAAIESGTPDGLANEICRALRERDQKHAVPWQAIYEERMARAKASGIDDQQAAALIKQLEDIGRRDQHPFQLLLDEKLGIISTASEPTVPLLPVNEESPAVGSAAKQGKKRKRALTKEG